MSLKSLTRSFKQLANGWLYRLVFLGSCALAFLYFLLVGLMIWKGDVWAYIIYAEDPVAHLAGGLLFLLLAHILRKGDVFTGRDWGMLTAKCFMLCFSLVMAFFIGEIGLRMILIKQQEAGSVERLREIKEGHKKIPIRSTHPLAAIIELSANMDLVYELQPNLNREFGGKLLKTNSKGMRSDNEYDEAKSAETLRIVGIGDSGMFGWNVEQGEEYLAVLERNLNAREDGINYEVLNFGVPGYNTALEAESLAFNGLRYDPDIVVVGWCKNDYQLPFFLLEKENFKRKDVSFFYAYLFNRKLVIELVAGRKVKSLRNYNRDMVEEETISTAGMEGIRTAFARLKKMSDEEDFKLIVLGAIKKEIRAILNALDIQYYSTFIISKEDYPEEYQIHFMHPRPGGHAVIAEKFAEHLESRNWLDLNEAATP